MNLQRAGAVVHYDIPWNPVKLDQRNGRAWRIGQQRPSVQAVYFIPESRRTRIIQTFTAKNRLRRKLLDPVSSNPLPACGERDRVRGSLLALPARLTRDSSAVALIRSLRAKGVAFPPEIARRYRAGMELLFEEMAHEYLDERRVRELEALLRAEEDRPV